MGADPSGSLPLYSIANFTAVNSGLWDEPPILLSVLGLDTLQQLEQPDARSSRAAAGALARRLAKQAGARLSRLFRSRQRARDAQRLFDGGLSQRASRARFMVSSRCRPKTLSSQGFPHAAHAGGWAFLASAFGGEHGFNGAMLSGAEAARLAAARLEIGAE